MKSWKVLSLDSVIMALDEQPEPTSPPAESPPQATDSEEEDYEDEEVIKVARALLAKARSGAAVGVGQKLRRRIEKHY